MCKAKRQILKLVMTIKKIAVFLISINHYPRMQNSYLYNRLERIKKCLSCCNNRTKLNRIRRIVFNCILGKFLRKMFVILNIV